MSIKRERLRTVSDLMYWTLGMDEEMKRVLTLKDKPRGVGENGRIKLKKQEDKCR